MGVPPKNLKKRSAGHEPNRSLIRPHAISHFTNLYNPGVSKGSKQCSRMDRLSPLLPELLVPVVAKVNPLHLALGVPLEGQPGRASGRVEEGRGALRQKLDQVADTVPRKEPISLP